MAIKLIAATTPVAHQAYRRNNTSGASSLSPSQHQWRIKLSPLQHQWRKKLIAAKTPVAHQAYRRHNTSGASGLSPSQHQWRIKLIAATTPVAHGCQSYLVKEVVLLSVCLNLTPVAIPDF